MRYHQAVYDEPLLIELGGHGKCGTSLPEWNDIRDVKDIIYKGMIRDDLDLPELTEPEIMTHFLRLSQMNYGVDNGIYPLGSCTMKYNPKINDIIASNNTFGKLHPRQPDDTVQGLLKVLYELQVYLSEIGGFHTTTLQPAAGAQGEFTGLLIARKYHKVRGEDRDEVIVPDSAHGTNPASAVMAGFKLVTIKSGEDGEVDIEALKDALSEKTAAFMITNPSTLGIFERKILKIRDECHKAGALLYYDGANLNALMGKARPGDMGFDIMHFNLHKTFSTPHGGGGPGSGPVGVTRELKDYLPVPIVVKEGERYRLDNDLPNTIGKVKEYFGNVGVLVRAWAYIRIMGAEGLKRASEMAVLNASYIRHRIEEHYPVPFSGMTKHEFVSSADPLKDKGGSAKGVAKILAERGLHPPTNYFPLIVSEALMIEPTETVTLREMDKFSDALIDIAINATTEDFDMAPRRTSVSRVDEVLAAKELRLNWRQL